MGACNSQIFTEWIRNRISAILTVAQESSVASRRRVTQILELFLSIGDLKLRPASIPPLSVVQMIAKKKKQNPQVCGWNVCEPQEFVILRVKLSPYVSAWSKYQISYKSGN